MLRPVSPNKSRRMGLWGWAWSLLSLCFIRLVLCKIPSGHMILTAMVHTILCNRAVWSENSMSTYRIIKYCRSTIKDIFKPRMRLKTCSYVSGGNVCITEICLLFEKWQWFRYTCALLSYVWEEAIVLVYLGCRGDIHFVLRKHFLYHSVSAFAFGSVTLDGLHIASYFESPDTTDCKSDIFILVYVMHLLFTFVQTFFLFKNHKVI